MIRKVLIAVVVLIVVVPVVALAAMSALSKRPSNLGATEGRLTPCPDSPNCVSSQAEDEAHRGEPFSFDGPAEEALDRLRAVIEAMPRTNIVTSSEGYLHAEFTSAVFRFVDDVEFVTDQTTGKIHYRSASRTGHSDMGANRKRIEAIRQKFEASGPDENATSNRWSH